MKITNYKSTSFHIQKSLFPAVLVCIFLNLKIYSQDIIIKKNGESIEVKIEQIDKNEIKYKRFDNLEGPLYIISRSKIEKIAFENGTEEVFYKRQNSEKISLNETKEFILESINNHGYDRDAFKWKYNANFEGNLLRLTHYKKNSNSELKNDGLLYDFSNVYKFHDISKRSDKLAFLNVWVSVCENEKKNKWEKQKLVMRLDDPDIANSLLKALKYYNAKLLEMEKEGRGDSKF